MKKIAILLVFVIVLPLVYLIISNYNNVPKLDEDVKEKWSQVQNQYKRRADLIPNLVSTVKGYAVHEKDTFIEVTEARSKVSQMNINADTLNSPAAMQQFSNAQAGLSGALSKLMLVVERYPDLKANANFMALQSQLEGTENRITVARKDFIASVKKYNIELRTMPGKLVAAIVHPSATVKETFTATQAEQEAPKSSILIMYINETDKQAISDSIELLESKSSAELVAVVTKKSATYKYASSVISILIVCFISLVSLYFDISTIFLIQIQILSFLLLHFIFHKFDKLVLFLLPSFYKKSIASRYANTQFENLRLNRTKTKHALMFFVSIDEKYVEIITNDEISKEVSNDYWQVIVDKFIKDVKNGDLSSGYLKAINSCSTFLIKEFPIQEDDVNELPNDVIELV